MKNILTILTASSCLLGALPLSAQFSSGSTGADGPLDVTSNLTLTLPASGILNCTTISISPNVTLRFTNALNTPVYLLATSNVTIAGLLDVSGGHANGGIPGRGGPGGFDGGFGGFAEYPDGDGQGPGGGSPSRGYGAVFGLPLPDNTNTYGNTLISPLIGGSGGAAKDRVGGGGGGGAILIASTTRISFSGAIWARGGQGRSGGSGGAVRLVAASVEGSGVIDVTGGSASSPGGAGRSRIDAQDRYAHRNITLTGRATRGSQMVVLPTVSPRLDIVEAAGTVIPVGTNVPVAINLPPGSPTNQTIRVRAAGFTNDVPIVVAITPENGPSARFPAVITYAGATSDATVAVTLPVDTLCNVHVWSR